MSQFASSPDHQSRLLAAQDENPNNPFFDAEVNSPIEAIEHYCRSHLAFQRLAYAQGIAAASKTASYQDCVEVLLPLVEQLVRDHEPEIRSVAVQQICGLGAALHEKDAERSLRDIEATLLVCAQQCALDDEEEVSQEAVLAFQQLALLLPAPRATAASKRAVDRLEVRGTDDGTLAAVRLLAHTAGCWTHEALRRHVPRYVNRWANHRDFSVREAVATCMSLIVKAMPLHLCHQLLLPFFYQLCRDSNWRVRRACSVDLPRLAQCLQQQQQQQHGAQEQQQQAAAVCGRTDPSNNSSSSSTELPDGSCCTKASTCLRTIRLSSELGSLSTGNLLSPSPSGMQNRNRSSSAVNLPLRSAATTAQIMTKHPMHSSLITDSLMSANSPSNSAPASPTSTQQQQQQSLATEIGQEKEEQQQQQPGSTSSNARAAAGGSAADGAGSDSSDEQQLACQLEAAAPLLHDCWCALRQCMELLTADSSHWVKVAAMSGLGSFLLLLPACQIGQLLLGRFTSMAGSTVVIYEISVALSCAQSFGQLAVRLGLERWPDMRDAWQALQTSRDPAVLCELVKALPGLVAAMGPAITVHELLPALAGLLQSHLGWVSGQLVAVMAELLELLPPSSQDMLLKVLEQLALPSSDRGRSWRLRRDLALQLGRMAAAAGPEAVTDSLWPAAITLCCDPVAAVRTAAASQVGPLLAALPPSLLCRKGSANGGGTADSSSSSSYGGSSSSNAANAGVSAGVSPRDVLHCPGRVTFASTSSSKASTLSKLAAASDDDINGEADDCSDTANNTSIATATPAATSRQSEHSSRPDSNSTTSSSHAGGSSSHHTQAASDSRSSGTYSVRFQALASSDGFGSRHPMGYGMGFNLGGRSSLELELDLPSALAPAPAGFAAAGGDADQCSSRLHGTSALLQAGDSGDSSDGSCNRGSSSDVSSGSESDTGAGSSNSSDGSVSEEEQEKFGGKIEALQQQPDTEQQQQLEGKHRLQQLNSSSTSVEDQQQQQQQSILQQRSPAVSIHPAMMPVGHPAMVPVGHPAMMPVGHPAMIPVGSQQQRSQPVAAVISSSPVPAAPAHTRAKSAGDLLKVEAIERRKRRSSSTSMPARMQSLPAMVSHSCYVDSDFDPSLPEPGTADPHQYITCLVNFFGCSPNHQQRQLFVPLVMAVLAACHDRLSCGQASQLLDRLEVLATDAVAGVRYAVAAALQDLKQQAAQLQPHLQQNGTSQGQVTAPEGQRQRQQQQQQQHTGSSSTAQQEVEGASAGASALESVDSYHDYVKQLAEKSCCSCGGASDGGSGSQSSAADAAPSSSGTSACLAGAGAAKPSSAAEAAGHHGRACEECGMATAGGTAGLEWLVKLSSCQQLERLMGVVALTTGPV